MEALDAALEPPLRKLARGSQPEAGDAALAQFSIASLVLHECTKAARAIQLTAAEAAGLARAAKLLLRSGTAALRHGVPSHNAASATDPDARERQLMFEHRLAEQQVFGMQGLLILLCEPGALARPAADVAAWLDAVAAVLAKHAPGGPAGATGVFQGLGADVRGSLLWTVCSRAQGAACYIGCAAVAHCPTCSTACSHPICCRAAAAGAHG